MTDGTIKWFLVALLLLSAASWLIMGRVHLYMAPEKWRQVDKRKDPVRFWLLIVALVVVAIAIAIF